MTEHGVMSDSPTIVNGENGQFAPETAQLRVESLEQRVRRLEEAVAVLQDTGHLEERVVERVTSRLSQAPRAIPQDSRTMVLQTARQLLPAALAVVNTGADQAEQQQAYDQPQAARPWLLFDLYAEVRTMVHMFLDRRYRVTWLGRVGPAVLLVAILISGWWLSALFFFLPSFMVTILDKIMDLLLAFIAFKILSREVRRYREAVANSPSTHAY